MSDQLDQEATRWWERYEQEKARAEVAERRLEEALAFHALQKERAEKAEAELAVLTSGGACVDGCCLPDEYTKTAALWVSKFHKLKGACNKALSECEQAFEQAGAWEPLSNEAVRMLREALGRQTREAAGEGFPVIHHGTLTIHCDFEPSED